MSIDGKIVSDPLLLKQFNLAPSHDLLENWNWKNTKKLIVILLPLLIGGKNNPTLLGRSGEFLENPLQFSLFKKKVKKRICYLEYRCF